MHQDFATNLAASLARSCYKSCKCCTNLAVLHVIWPLSCKSCKILLPRILQDYLDVQESYKGRTKIVVQDLRLARSCTTSSKIFHEILQDLACQIACKIFHKILQDLACQIFFIYLSPKVFPENYHVALLYPFAV